jgi:hypothetical protein
MTEPVTPHRSSARPASARPASAQAFAAGLAATLLLGVAGCTGDPRSPGEDAVPSLPSRSVGEGATLAAKPVPLTLTVGKVRGQRLRKQQRRRLERGVSRVLSRYFEAAYLGGDYPRTDFSDALPGFSRGAVRRAAGDRPLLTNSAVGAVTESVVPRVKTARIDLFKPRRVVAGLTARFRLVFLQERVKGRDRRVTVKGRLLMSRTKRGPWEIFGYDVTRFSVPAKGGTR